MTVNNFTVQERKEMFDKSVSGYATTEMGEYIAESFALWRKGLPGADPMMIDAFGKLRRG